VWWWLLHIATAWFCWGILFILAVVLSSWWTSWCWCTSLFTETVVIHKLVTCHLRINFNPRNLPLTGTSSWKLPCFLFRWRLNCVLVVKLIATAIFALHKKIARQSIVDSYVVEKS
jgi:hypothetical protein